MEHMQQRYHATNEPSRGSIVVTIVIIMLFLSTLAYGVLLLANANVSRARGRIMLLQAQYSAESGADAAIAMLNSGNTTFTGTTSDVTVLTTTQYRATYAT